MAEVNRAFVLEAVNKVSFEQRPVPRLRDEHDVRVRIERTGICGSDVHYWQRGRIGDFVVTGPLVLSHESAGVVVEVGRAVANVRVGDRVAVEPGVPCRRCGYCRSGAYNLCPDTVFAATPPHDGTLQTYYTVAADYVYPLPAHLSADEGALVEPLAVAVEVAKVAGLRVGQTVLVFGCGPIGLLCQAVAKASGASKVIGVDRSEARARFARDFAADAVYVSKARPAAATDPVDAARADAEHIVAEHGLGDGADVVLECTGAEPCIQAGIFAARKGGMFVQAGMGRENVVFPIMTACIRALTVRGSIRYSAGCYPHAIQLIASGKIQPARLVTHRFSFDEADKAFDVAGRAQPDTLKVMIQGVPE